MTTNLFVVFFPPSPRDERIVDKGDASQTMQVFPRIARLIFKVLKRALSFRARCLRLIRCPERAIKGRSWVLSTRRREDNLYRSERLFRHFLVPRLIVTLMVVVVVRAIRDVFLLPIRTPRSRVVLGNGSEVVRKKILTIKGGWCVTCRNVCSLTCVSAFFVFLVKRVDLRFTLNVVFQTRFVGIVIDVLCRYFFCGNDFIAGRLI